MKPKLYRLNHNWLGYKKGHVFEADNERDIFTRDGYIRESTVDLLIKSGALTEIKKPEEVKLPEKLDADADVDTNDPLSREAINQIIAYLEAKNNK